LTLVSARIDEEWFGLDFPNKCDDAYADTDVKNCETPWAFLAFHKTTMIMLIVA
jgi:hypothetical protein